MQSMKTNVDLYLLLQIVVRTYGVFMEGEKPLTPLEASHVSTLREFLHKVERAALRTCWDGKAYCRYRDEICHFTAQELNEDRAVIHECRYRGKDIK